MMKILSILVLTSLFISCASSVPKEAIEKAIVDARSKKIRYKSSEYLKYSSEYKDGKWFVKGESSIKNFAEAVKAELDPILGEGNSEVFFEEFPKEKKFLRVISSVTPLRRNPAHSAEQIDQALMGAELQLIKKENFWWLIKTPYNYVAYVARWAVKEMSDEEYKNWKANERLIYTASIGKIYSEKNKKSEQISDVVLGAIMPKISESKNWYEVQFTDEKTGFIPKESAVVYTEKKQDNSDSNQLLRFESDLSKELSKDEITENITNLALSLKGVPYLWGGTSPKGYDCSGYTQSLYKMSGILLPRDAYQQRNEGKAVEYSKEDFSKLKKGDLLFFGPNSNKITHVGVSLGKDMFIHCSGDVHMNSFDKANEKQFSEYLLSRLQDVKRML